MPSGEVSFFFEEVLSALRNKIGLYGALCTLTLPRSLSPEATSGSPISTGVGLLVTAVHPKLETPPTQRGDSRGDRETRRAALPPPPPVLSCSPHTFPPPPLRRGEVTRETSPSYDVTKGGPPGEEGAGPR